MQSEPESEPEPGPDVEFTVHTPHLNIAPAYDGPLCAGTIAQWEDQAAYLVDLWDIELPRPIPMYIFMNPDQVNYLDYCDSGGIACYNGPTASIYTGIESAPHEIVHAVLAPVGHPTSLMVESTAEAFAGDTAPRYTGVLTPPNFLLHKSYDHYHFMRWLAQAFSPATFIELYAAMPKNADSVVLNEVLEEILGLSEEELIAEYRATAAYVYPGHSMCQSEPLAWQGDGFLDHTITLDCSDINTFGPFHRLETMSAKVVVELSEDASYSFAAEDEEGNEVPLFARRCANSADFDPEAPAKFSIFHEVQLFGMSPLAAGPYEIVAKVPLQEGPISVRIFASRLPP
ncbi:MAG TPA: hypothetical protein ENJ18_05150 [Nannocystis exedens]|nr:hypothetical protein [Nannocystis exedens]